MVLRVLGSMATRGLLAELAAAWEGDADLTSIGGVEAARRVREGEAVDVVILAAAAMHKLAADGFLVPGTLAGVAIASMVAAVRTGQAPPDLADEAAVRRAVLAAPRTGYSTGPSGDHLLALLQSWGVRDTLGDRLVQAPPGTPVGHLLAEGAVDLAFQQRSELMDRPGITIAGPLPPAIAADTCFAAAIARASAQPETGRRFITALLDPANADLKRRHGMQPAPA